MSRALKTAPRKTARREVLARRILGTRERLCAKKIVFKRASAAAARLLSAARRGFITLAFFVSGALFFAEQSAAFRFPVIRRLHYSDEIFIQYQDDVKEARRLIARGETHIAPQLYEFTAPNDLKKSRETGDPYDIFSIAARCNVPYDAIAALNRISSSTEDLSGRTLLLPTVPGLFVFSEEAGPLSPVERLIASDNFFADADENDFTPFVIAVSGIQTPVRARFFQNALFNDAARVFFLSPDFIFPLERGAITSEFGYRNNPVSGNRIFHRGIDIAASRGSDVYAAKAGVVITAAYNPIYGNYVEILHDNGWKSLYGHLDSIKVRLRQTVVSGYTIGAVGSTGQSTGPHLHFEMIKDGEAQNPLLYLPADTR